LNQLTDRTLPTRTTLQKLKTPHPQKKNKILWLPEFGTFCFAAYTQANPSGKTKRAKFFPTLYLAQKTTENLVLLPLFRLC
jgi:hypothetical protein